MGFLGRLLARALGPSDDGAPFMEHPTGRFATAVDAMADAIQRLRARPAGDDWITFSAQGMGTSDDSVSDAAIRFRRDEIEVDAPLDVEQVTQQAGVPTSSLTRVGEKYSLAQATPAEAARCLDAIFRHHLGIRPFPDEQNDYAVGAEW